MLNHSNRSMLMLLTWCGFAAIWTGSAIASNPLTANLIQRDATPNPVAVGEDTNIHLSLEVGGVVELQKECETTKGPTYSWDYVSVEYCAEAGDPWILAPDASVPGYTLSLSWNPNLPTADYTSHFSGPGFWRIKVKGTVSYETANCGTMSKSDEKYVGFYGSAG